MPTHLPVSKKKKNLHIHHMQPATAFDHVVMVVSFLYTLSGIPQIIAVYSGKTDGVSVLSWLIFLFCATLFLIYGLRRRVPPMIISNSIWIIVDGLVVAGLLLSGSHVTWL